MSQKVLAWLITLPEGQVYPALDKRIADGAEAEGMTVTPLIALSTLQSGAEGKDGDAGYLRWRLAEIMPLFEEARDALPAITELQRSLRGISSTLAARMDTAGTRTREEYTALQPGQGEGL